MRSSARRARLVASGLVLLALCGACWADPPPPDVEQSFLDETRRELGCASDPYWCSVLDRFEAGRLPPETIEAYALVGVGRNAFTGLDRVRYFLAEPGERMLVGEVTPDTPAEEQQLVDVVATLRGGGALPESAPVVQFVRGLVSSSSYTPDATEVAGRSRHRRDGSYELWVRQNGAEIITLTRDAMGTGIAVYRR